MTELGELKKFVTAEIKDHYESLGFVRPRRMVFERELDEGRCGVISFLISIQKSLDWVRVEPYVKLRFHRVEEMWSRVWVPIMGDPPDKDFATLHETSRTCHFKPGVSLSSEFEKLYGEVESVSQPLWSLDLDDVVDGLATKRILHPMHAFAYPVCGIVAGRADEVKQYVQQRIRDFTEEDRSRSRADPYAPKYLEFAEKLLGETQS